MRMIRMVISLIALATAPSHAAQTSSMEKRCHEMVGNEEREGEGREQPRWPAPSATLQRLDDSGAPH